MSKGGQWGNVGGWPKWRGKSASW